MKRYEEYRNSGVRWVEKIPAQWSVSKLKWLTADSEGGVWGDDPSDDGISHIVLRSTEQTTDGKWCIDNPAVRDLSGVPNMHKYALRDGDLLITKSSGSESHIGKTTIYRKDLFDEEVYYSNFMQRLRVLDEAIPEFFWYLLNSDLSRVQYCFLQNSTSGLGNLSSKTIGQLVVPKPDRHTQERIVAYLDAKTAEIDELINQTKGSIDLLEEYRQSVISETVTKGLNPDVSMKDSGVEWIGEIPEHWDIVKLANVATRRSGHTPDKKRPEYWENGSIIWISLADSPMLREQRYVQSSNSFTNELGIENSSAEIVPAGSVLLSRDATVGLCAIAKCDLAVSQHFMAYECGGALYNEYLLDIFNAMNQEFSRLSMGSTIPTIGLPLVKQFHIPLPPIEEQREIEDYLIAVVENIDNQISLKRQIRSLLAQYRKSLISEAVTGKFKVPGVE